MNRINLQHLFAVILLVGGMLLGCHKVQASNCEFEHSYNFMVYNNGNGTLHFKLLVWAYGSMRNHWAYDYDSGNTGSNTSTVYIKYNGQEYALLKYAGDNSVNKNKKYGRAKIWNKLSGQNKFAITNERNATEQHVVEAGEDYKLDIEANNTEGNKYLEFDWYPDPSLINQEVTIRAHIGDEWCTSHSMRDYDLGKFSFSEKIDPIQLFDPVFYPDTCSIHAGQLAVPYVSMNEPISYATCFYPSKNNKCTESSGYIYVESCDSCLHNFYLDMTVKFNELGTTRVVRSKPITLPAYHKIYNLQAKSYTDSLTGANLGYKCLTWETHHPTSRDIMPSDEWEIQRAYTPDFSDAQTIDVIPYQTPFNLETEEEEGVEKPYVYTYIDKSPEAAVNALSPDRPIYYRVRRVSSYLWGWEHAWAAATKISQPLLLATPIASAIKIDTVSNFSEERMVRFTIPLRSTDALKTASGNLSCETMWDENALLYLISKAGNETPNYIAIPSDSIKFDAKQKRWVAHYFDKPLTPCKRYSYELYLDTATSALPVGVLGESSVKITLDASQYDNFYFHHAAKVTNLRASSILNDRIELSWNTNAGDCDYFNIKRRRAGTPDPWTTLDSMYNEYTYTDRTILHDTPYEYSIESVLDCDGHLTNSSMIEGLSPWGAELSGKVQFASGTAQPGIKVAAQGPTTFINGALLTVKQKTSPFDLPTQDNTTLVTLRNGDKKFTSSEQRTFVLTVGRGKEHIEEACTLLQSGDYQIKLYPSNGSPLYTIVYKNQRIANIGVATPEVVPLVLTIYPSTGAAYHCAYQWGGQGQTVSKELQGTLTSAGATSTQDFLVANPYVAVYELDVWNRVFTPAEMKLLPYKDLNGKEEGLEGLFRFHNTWVASNFVPNCVYTRDNFLWSYAEVQQGNHALFALNKKGRRFATSVYQNKELTVSGRQYWDISDNDGSYTIHITGSQPTDITCTVQPQATNGIFTTVSHAKNYEVTLSGTHTTEENINFYNSEHVRFSGRVLYAGTTIPVGGAYFQVNGADVKTADGILITTDNQGEFSFSVPKNQDISIRTLMDGHHFLHGGYFRMGEQNDSILTLTGNLDNVRMYDETTVRLIGRVAGGNKQAAYPLGLSLSANNLGDNLQMVLALEGNDVAHLVNDPSDPSVKTRSVTTMHADGEHKTQALWDIKNITLRPDSLTGEYAIDLPPVKWKITQATAKGYATLMDKHLSHPVIDLTNSLGALYQKEDTAQLVPYNKIYSINYHNPVELTYKQLYSSRALDYVGEAALPLSDFNETVTNQPLYQIQGDSVCYILGYPVFDGTPMSGGRVRNYEFRLSAYEAYYYNNDPTDYRHEQVPQQGGEVKVVNGMDGINQRATMTVRLAADGTGRLLLPVSNPNFSITGEDALRTVSMVMEVNGELVYAQPLRGFVTGARTLGTDVVGKDIDLLDVLRDPPGTNSYAWLEMGTTFSSSYNIETNFKAGMELNITMGKNYTNVTGTVAGSVLNAFIWENTNANQFPIDVTYTGKTKNSYSYQLTTTERIQTSKEATYVGAAGNVYIGTEVTELLHRVKSIHLISDSAYQTLLPSVKAGVIKEIAASPATEKAAPMHLVIADQIALTAAPSSSFAYSQRHILKNLLPELLERRAALINTGDSATVQAIANNTGKVCYRSLVPLNDKNFASDTLYYVMHKPAGKEDFTFSDEVANLNQLIESWSSCIMANEMLTLQTINKGELLDNHAFSISAGASKQYTATATSSYTYNSTLLRPFSMAANTGVKLGSSIVSFLTSLLPSMSATARTNSYVFDMFQRFYKNKDANNQAQELEMTGGIKVRFKLKPVLDLTLTPNEEQSEKFTRTAGFYIEPGSHGHINVSVYRVPKAVTSKGLTGIGWNEIAVEDENIRKRATDITDTFLDADDDESANFVYFLNGGATRCPYEDAERTKVYNPGTIIGNATLKIDNPKIAAPNPIVSGVPEGEAAVFDLILSNESEAPDADNGLIDKTFELNILPESNPNGAKFSLDGVPFTTGLSLIVPRGQAVHKKLEVRRGTSDDYEHLGVRLSSSCQFANSDTTFLSVHFLPSSTPVTLTEPTDKWVMNTRSPQDDTGYYLPVKIDGFDVNYRNFDHIELQYKKTTQPDEDYVNLCSYYANDSLYNLASGNKAKISGGSINNIYFYGENDPIEQKYDLRAVSYCRLGNTYVTSSSQVLSGTKDTRCPQLFGSILPKNGILGIGDYISVPFSENIAGNYLDKDNNFQIVGYTNKTGITASTSLSFDGTQGTIASTTTTRNLDEKDFTIDLMMKPADQNSPRDMVIFSQGTPAQNISFGRTQDYRLFLSIQNTSGTHSVYSKPLTTQKSWVRVAASYETATGAVHFYEGTSEITDSKNQLSADYSGVGTINYGNDFSGEKPYLGSLLEARVWTRALQLDELAQTNQTVLTGYERKLLAYYPMNEGVGNTVADKANGADIVIKGQTWNLPAGRSLHFDGTRGVQLDKKYFNRSHLDDYTLAFWFKADEQQASDTVALYAEGPGTRGQKGLCIGLTNKQVFVQQNGYKQQAKGNWQDGNWHQFALSVNRPRNFACVYIDGKATNQFPADSLLALGAQDIWLGECNWTTKDSVSEHFHTDYRLKGNIDDLMLWETALPQNYLELFYNTAPNGGEMGLLCNLTFSDSKANDNNILETRYSGLNHLTVRENNATIANAPLILSDYAESMSDAQSIAPIKEKGELTNMNFSWASRDNELIINLDMLDKEINKQNIFLTVRDVEDLAGNPQKSPMTWTIFVDRNQIKWKDKYVNRNLIYGQNDEFTIDIQNLGGTTMNYVIEDLPSWLTTKQEKGSLAPTDVKPITFKINNTLDPGEHTVIIYLTDENGLSEPLFVTATVEAEMPQWSVDKTKYPQTMNLIGQVHIQDSDDIATDYIDTDEEDMVGVFLHNECIGVQKITPGQQLANLYITIYGNDDVNTTFINGSNQMDFLLWRAKTGKISELTLHLSDGTPLDTLSFGNGKLVGLPDDPVIMTTTVNRVQMISLETGWNWISFNVKPNTRGANFFSTFTNRFPFCDGDLIKGNGKYSQYKESKEDSYWYGYLTQFYPQYIYMINVKNSGQLEVQGDKLTSAQQKLTLRPGWNNLPYYPTNIQSVQTAMSQYYDYATTGDMIRSYTQFCVFSNGKWEGNLTHFKPGCGYMLLRKASTEVPFYYPNLIQESASEALYLQPIQHYGPVPTTFGQYSGNMPIIAKALRPDGTPAQQGDVLQAFDKENLVGEISADEQGRFFLMTSTAPGDNLSFRLLSSGGDSDADVSTEPILSFDETTCVGTLQNPYLVDFRNAKVSAVPSPFTDYVRFTAVTKPGQTVQISIYDASGNQVYSHTDTASGFGYTHTANQLSRLSSGIYMAQITVAGKPYSLKLIKK